MDGYYIAALKNVLESGFFIARIRRGSIGVIELNETWEALHHFGNSLCDCAKTHHTDGFTGQFTAFELKVGGVGAFVPVVTGEPLPAWNSFPHQVDHVGQEHFCNGLSIAGGSMKNGNTMQLRRF